MSHYRDTAIEEDVRERQNLRVHAITKAAALAMAERLYRLFNMAGFFNEGDMVYSLLVFYDDSNDNLNLRATYRNLLAAHESLTQGWEPGGAVVIKPAKP